MIELSDPSGPEVTRPALREELLLLARRDQQVRDERLSDQSGSGSNHSRGVWVDQENLRRFKQIVRQDGFPTRAMVGSDGVAAAWLLLQHADGDPDFQAQMLPVVEKVWRGGEISGQQYALLVDRVLVSQEKPQRYGTQFEEVDGELEPKPIEDEKNIDERRRAVGLGSLADYSCVLRVMYGNAGSAPDSTR